MYWLIEQTIIFANKLLQMLYLFFNGKLDPRLIVLTYLFHCMVDTYRTQPVFLKSNPLCSFDSKHQDKNLSSINWNHETISRHTVGLRVFKYSLNSSHNLPPAHPKGAHKVTCWFRYTWQPSCARSHSHVVINHVLVNYAPTPIVSNFTPCQWST